MKLFDMCKQHLEIMRQNKATDVERKGQIYQWVLEAEKQIPDLFRELYRYVNAN